MLIIFLGFSLYFNIVNNHLLNMFGMGFACLIKAKKFGSKYHKIVYDGKPMMEYSAVEVANDIHMPNTMIPNIE